ncbi:MAG: hypothetical protein EOP63_13950 [Sphingomonadales bacterium]|nr:MAG: hypothetical protein EOP63_13950 [Sphingomonadales bacterium]
MILIVVTIGVLAIAAAAHAQNTGTRIGPSPAQIPDHVGMSKDDRSRLAMYRYAECVVDRWRARVDAYLVTFPGSTQAREMANKLSVDECLSTGEMQFSESLFRGGIYDVLYRKRFQKEGALDFSAVPAIDYALGSEADAYSPAGPKITLRKLADCTVRKAPEDSRVLVLSMVASNGENSAFDKIVPSMSSCIVHGSTVTFSKAIFRGVIGEALYRLSANASQPTAAVKD